MTKMIKMTIILAAYEKPKLTMNDVVPRTLEAAYKKQHNIALAKSNDVVSFGTGSLQTTWIHTKPLALEAFRLIRNWTQAQAQVTNPQADPPLQVACQVEDKAAHQAIDWIVDYWLFSLGPGLNQLTRFFELIQASFGILGHSGSFQA